MKEQEYIDVKDLGHIESIKNSLYQITPVNSSIIDEKKFAMITDIIWVWEQGLRKTININDESI